MRRLALDRAGVFLLILAPAVALFRDTLYQGQDFAVLWQASRHLWLGEPLYDLARDGAMVFKYPPWTAVLLLPVGILPFVIAKWIWAVCELASLGYTCFWLKRRMQVSLSVLLITLFSFWGIWAVHFLDGQITLLMLALALFAFEKRLFWLGFLGMSTKIFTSISLFGWGRWRARDLAVAGVVSFGLLFSISLWTGMNGPVDLVRSWKAAAVSGGELFQGEKVRGRDNQGLPAFFLRVSGIPARESDADAGVALVCAVVLGFYWWKRSSGLAPRSQWVGWLALAAVVHPLAWFHSFVLVFPLVAVSADRAWRDRNSLSVLVSTGLGVVFVALVTRKTFGALGEALEWFSIKSWGSVALLESLRRTGLSEAGAGLDREPNLR